MQLVRVALDVPLPTLFDYRLEPATRELIGTRIAAKAPFCTWATMLSAELSHHFLLWV